MSKATPGPWIVGYSGMTVSTDPGDMMAQIEAGQQVTIVRICDCKNENYLTPEQCKANARLIAAAPELLAALRECVDLLSHLKSINGIDGLAVLEAAKEIIAKAEGNGAK